MSEYQYVAFRAIDRPLSEPQLAYVRRQSTRAEITPWSFKNEYHYGDFRGNAVELLRRGYDVHLHYANFGIRKLLIRIPYRPWDAGAVKPYFASNALRFLKDKTGTGGILAIEPFHEAGDLDELWEVDSLLDRLVPLRAEILNGDLRPLYVAHLAIVGDGEHDPEETREAPVPVGLGALSDAQRALAELYGLGDELIAATAQASPPIPTDVSPTDDYLGWLRREPETTKNAWLVAWMTDPSLAVRAEILAKYQRDCSAPAWPTARPHRTIAQLRDAAAEIAREAQAKAVASAARQRAKRLVEMAADPTATVRETERLVAQRTARAYRRIGELLAELREALSDSGRSNLAEKQAHRLKAAHPTLRLLTSELRRQGFVPK
jgi:cell division septum initiation protein DivIVA